MPGLFRSIIASALVASSAALSAGTLQPEAGYLNTWAGEFAGNTRAVPQWVEMLEVDGINRKGKWRIESTGETRNFTMLPAGTVNYRGGYTDLRYVPVGTRMLAFVQPDQETATSRVFQLADDLAVQMRRKQTFRIEQVTPGATTLLSVSSTVAPGEKLSVALDNWTVIWKGTGKGAPVDLKTGQELIVNFQPQTNGATWKCAEVWLGTGAVTEVMEQTRTNYVRYLTLRGLPGQVGATTRDTFEVTLFTGADRSLRTQFKEGTRIHVAAADERLRTYGQEVDRVGAQIQKVEVSQDASGEEIVKLSLQVRVMLEGFRPGRNVRAWAEGWPVHGLPREERLFPWDQFNLPDIGNLPKEPMLTLPFALPIPPK